MGVTIDEIARFYIKPKELLNDKFEKEWDTQSRRQLIELKDNFMKNLQSDAKDLSDYFTDLSGQITKRKSDIISTNLFVMIINQNDDAPNND